MTNSTKAMKILEVACGGGFPSTVFLQSYMSPKAVYFCCDFAENMVAETRNSINSAYISLDPKFKHTEVSFEEKVSIDSVIINDSNIEK